MHGSKEAKRSLLFTNASHDAVCNFMVTRGISIFLETKDQSLVALDVLDIVHIPTSSS